MELKSNVDAICRVSATLEEGGAVSVRVFAQAEYAPGATTTAEVNDVPQELRSQLQSVMEKILTSAENKLGPRLQRAIHKSTEVAASYGEI